MRDLVERDFVDGVVGRERVTSGRGKARRSVTVNQAESPLAWLRARGLLDARQFEAGERLRGDYEMAALAARVTMGWNERVDSARSAGEALDPVLAQIAAKRRFDAAIDAVGKGLGDVLWRVVCAGEALPVAEKALGWPQRAGRLVLTLALDRLADSYGLR
ncbi:DUF6456 domain-containing protein [Sphingomonas sp. UYP23]